MAHRLYPTRKGSQVSTAHALNTAKDKLVPKEYVYMSSHPDVIEAWDKHEAELEKRRLRIKAWSDETGRGLQVQEWSTKKRALGITRLPGELMPPDGWRELEYDDDVFVPNKRTKLGKEHDKWLDSFTHENIRAVLNRVGAPAEIIRGNRIFNPGVRRISDNVYVTYSIEVDEMGEQWERILLSGYYAILEAVEANQAEENQESVAK